MGASATSETRATNNKSSGEIGAGRVNPGSSWSEGAPNGWWSTTAIDARQVWYRGTRCVRTRSVRPTSMYAPRGQGDGGWGGHFSKQSGATDDSDLIHPPPGFNRRDVRSAFTNSDARLSHSETVAGEPGRVTTPLGPARRGWSASISEIEISVRASVRT